jgi:tRNA-Thr(GGU) m(6)t(6)A37 methyltransferase TsaA
MSEYLVQPIGFVSSPRVEIDDDNWGDVIATITIDQSVLEADALVGLETFSHVEIIYLFDQIAPERALTGSRHPRGNPAWPKVGVLAQRAKFRVNRIGLTTCELIKVGENFIEVRGLDAIHGSPVLDIKPFMVEFAPKGEVREPSWVSELMNEYW